MPTFKINHYIPSLGSPSAGGLEFTESIGEALESVEHSLLHLKEGEKIVIERVVESD